MDWPDGFGLIRASNTTPVLVLRFEGHTTEALHRIETAMLALLERVKPGCVGRRCGALIFLPLWALAPCALPLHKRRPCPMKWLPTNAPTLRGGGCGDGVQVLVFPELLTGYLTDISHTALDPDAPRASTLVRCGRAGGGADRRCAGYCGREGTSLVLGHLCLNRMVAMPFTANVICTPGR